MSFLSIYCSTNQFLNINLLVWKMKKEHLTKISLMISIVGTLVLITLAEYTHPPILKINEITDEHLESKITLQAKILTIRNNDGLSFLILSDSTGTIKALTFDELDIEKNSKIEIEGVVEKYQGEFEILIDKINLLE